MNSKDKNILGESIVVKIITIDTFEDIKRKLPIRPFRNTNLQ